MEKKNITLNELKDMQVAGIAGTRSSDLARSQNVRIKLTQNIGEAFDLLENNSVDGVISSDIVAKYYLQQHRLKQKYIVASLERQQNESAFAVPINSPLLHTINLTLITLQDNQQTMSICARYLKDKDAARCNL